MLSAVSMLSADACAYNGVQATVPSRASVNMQIKYSSMMGGEGLSVLEGAERALNEDFEKPWTAGSDISPPPPPANIVQEIHARICCLAMPASDFNDDPEGTAVEPL